MGIAMLLVMLFHSTISFDFMGHLIIFKSVINFIREQGNCGVDIFIFVSGIGMYFSCRKSQDIKKFYYNRFKRIVPTYFIIVTIFSIILMKLGALSFKSMLLEIMGLRMLLNRGYLSWYISAILILYLIVPIFMKYYEKNTKKALIIFLSLAFILNLICEIQKLNYIRIFTSRIPIFFIGIKFGEMSYKNEEIKNNGVIKLLVSLLLGIIIVFYYRFRLISDNRFYNVQKYGYLLMVIPLCIILAGMFEKIKRVYNFRIIEFIGTLTLEIYILHERIIILFAQLNLGSSFDEYRILINIVIFILTLVISIIFNKIISVAMTRDKIKRNVVIN